MREIKFRARFIEDNRWYYFTLEDIARLGGAFINYCDWCQSTGLYDKNGKELFEGDVLAYAKHDIYAKYGIKKVVEWNEHEARFTNIGLVERMEIIGNVYESPELLK